MTHKLGNKIAEGAGSEVYEWDGEHKIVKLAKPNTSIDDLQQELVNSRVAWEYGLPVPEPFEFVTIGDRAGIVFERIYGESMLTRLQDGRIGQITESPSSNVSGDIVEARITARLLHQVHAHAAPPLRDQRERLTYDINRAPYLTEADKASVIAQLNQLPVKQVLCHGDPNPGNIVIRENDAVLIDWNDASTGNPEADLAEYVLLIRYATMPEYLNPTPEVKAFLDAAREKLVRTFLDEYKQLTGIGYEDIEPWFAPVAARKLSADAFTEAVKASLVEEVRRRIASK